MMTVRMTREGPSSPDGPTTADVHPDEVENMTRAGWIVAVAPEAEAVTPARKPRKAKD